MKLIGLLFVLSVVGCSSNRESLLYRQALDSLPKQEKMCIVHIDDRTLIAKCNGLKLDDIFKESKQLKQTTL